MKKTESDSSLSWHEYFNELAILTAKKSKDRSTKVGCVLVGPNHEIRSTGFNGFCRGVDDTKEEYHQAPEKYFWTEHAERNAIYNAARNGIPLDGCMAYVTMQPCADCARALIQSGIKTIMVGAISIKNEIWMESFKRSLVMCEEAGVEVIWE